MRLPNVKTIAVAGAGVWAGEKVSTFVGPYLPKSKDGTVNVTLARVVGYGVSGLVVVMVLRALAGKRG